MKKALRIALPDYYVIATAEKANAIALFKRMEKEMKHIFDDLERLGVKFPDQI